MEEKDIEQYEVTGLYVCSTRRFFLRTKDFQYAMCVNLWRGSIWARLKTGKRKLIKRVWN